MSRRLCVLLEVLARRVHVWLCHIVGRHIFLLVSSWVHAAQVPFNQTTRLYGKQVDWWVLDGTLPRRSLAPRCWLQQSLITHRCVSSLLARRHACVGDDPAEPFGYGFYRETVPATHQRIPAGFWFRSVDGFASQEFHDFQVTQPPPETWAVPEVCQNAPSCGFLAPRHPLLAAM